MPYCDYTEEIPLNIFTISHEFNLEFIDFITELHQLKYLNTSHITHLIIDRNKLKETAFIKLLQSKCFDNLEIIDYEDNSKINSDEVIELIELNYPNLSLKFLDGNDFKGDRLELLKKKDFSKVKKLVINKSASGYSSYTPSSIPLQIEDVKFIQTLNLENLEELHIDFIKFNKEAIDAFFVIDFKNVKKLFLSNVNEYIISKIQNLDKNCLENLNEFYIIKSQDYSMDEFLNAIMQAELESYITSFNYRFWSTNNYGNLDINLKIETISLMVSKSWPKLKIMNLEDSITTEAQLMELMKGDWSQIEYLELHQSLHEKIDFSFKSLLNSNWPNLKELYLSSCNITDSDMEQFSHGYFNQLEELYFINTSITYEGLSYLVKLSLPKLKRLIINQFDPNLNFVDDKAVVVLSKGNWPLLNDLYLDAKISNVGLFALTQSNWPLLKELSISATEHSIDDFGLHALRYANWKHLESLSLHNLNVTPRGIMDLTKANFPNLEDLSLRGEIDDSCLIALGNAHWSRLELLSLDNKEFTSTGLTVFLNRISDGRWPHFYRLSTMDSYSVSPENDEIKELINSYGYTYGF